MHHLEGNATLAAVFLWTDKLAGNYDVLLSAKLYTVICQIGYSFGAKKLTNVGILLLQLILLDRKHLTST